MTDMVYGTMPQRVSEPVIPKWWRTIDTWTLASVFALFGIGLLLGLAASVPLAERNGLDPYYYVTKQALFGGLGLMVMVLVSMMTPDAVRRWAVVGFVCTFLALVVLPFVGEDHGKGAVRWLSIAGFSIQPSEFLKPCFVLFSAWLVAASLDLNGPPGRWISFATTVVVAALLAGQPDFGQALLLVASWCVIFFIAGARWSVILFILSAILVAGFFAYGQSEHFAARINGFLESEIDARSQIGYAANAIQEGGLFGVGVNAGQVKFMLPDAHTDFIIAVAAEEYGLASVLIIIALYVTIALRSFWRLVHERDVFVQLAGVGLTSIFALQAFVNMGVAARILPSKGMTLPFVSYGGSSLIAAGLTIGMLLALTRSRPQGRMGDVFRGRS